MNNINSPENDFFFFQKFKGKNQRIYLIPVISKMSLKETMDEDTYNSLDPDVVAIDSSSMDAISTLPWPVFTGTNPSIFPSTSPSSITSTPIFSFSSATRAASLSSVSPMPSYPSSAPSTLSSLFPPSSYSLLSSISLSSTSSSSSTPAPSSASSSTY